MIRLHFCIETGSNDPELKSTTISSSSSSPSEEEAETALTVMFDCCGPAILGNKLNVFVLAEVQTIECIDW